VRGDERADLLGRGERLGGDGVGHDEQELLPAEAAEDVVLAHGLVYEPGELLQQLVAGEMAVRVVVVLEVVDVEQEHREQVPRRRGAGVALVVGRARRPVDELVQRLLQVLLVEDAREPVHLGRGLHAAHLRGRVQHLRAGLRHEPQRGLGVAAAPGLREHDHAERVLVEHERRDQVGLRHPRQRSARLDPARRRLRLEVGAAHDHLRLGREADLAPGERDLGADLDAGAVGIGRRHHEPRRLALLALRLRAPHQHRDVLRVEAALHDVQQHRRDLALGEAAVELARQAREVLQELVQELEVVLERGVRTLELRELLPRARPVGARLADRAAQAQQDRHENPRRDGEPQEEGHELGHAPTGLHGHLRSRT
jgi:hypothetical protein